MGFEEGVGADWKVVGKPDMSSIVGAAVAGYWKSPNRELSSC